MAVHTASNEISTMFEFKYSPLYAFLVFTIEVLYCGVHNTVTRRKHNS